MEKIFYSGILLFLTLLLSFWIGKVLLYETSRMDNQYSLDNVRNIFHLLQSTSTTLSGVDALAERVSHTDEESTVLLISDSSVIKTRFNYYAYPIIAKKIIPSTSFDAAQYDLIIEVSDDMLEYKVIKGSEPI